MGYNHPFIVAVDYDPTDPATLYLAAGNGLFRAAKRGEEWTQLTGSDVTELRDLAVDPADTKTIYFAYSHGLRVTHDRGETWTELAETYTGAIRKRFGSIVFSQNDLSLAAKRAFFEARTAARHGRSRERGLQILRIEQSPHDACEWLATTQGGGLFASHDCAKTFENSGRIGVGRDLYSISFDPTNSARIAIGGWGPGCPFQRMAARLGRSVTMGCLGPMSGASFSIPTMQAGLYASVQEDGIVCV